ALIQNRRAPLTNLLSRRPRSLLIAAEYRALPKGKPRVLTQILDYVRHLEQHLDGMVEYFGVWMYVVMFLVIFCETGLVVTPFLPGDSLLFALGALAARPDGLNLWVLIVLLTVAAILGDSANYWLGSIFGPRIFRGENVRFLNRKHLERTHEFYE